LFGGVSDKFSAVLHNVLCHRLEVFSKWKKNILISETSPKREVDAIQF